MSTSGVSRAAEKWVEMWDKYDDAINKWETHRQNNTPGLNNLKVGPPSFLDATTQGRWKARIIDTLRQCIRDLLIPYNELRLQEMWGNLRKLLLSSIENGGGDSKNEIGLNIVKGIRRGFDKKYNKGKEERKEINIRPPPPPSNNSVVKVDSTVIEVANGIEEKDIGTFRRGEPYTPYGGSYKIKVEWGKDKDPSKLIARAIYDTNNRQNFLYRNVVKYMDMYAVIEKEYFKRRYFKLKNGKEKKATCYTQARNLLQKKTVYMEMPEFRIIAILYQVQIRFFKEEYRKDKTYFRYIEQTPQYYSRVINVVRLRDEQWSILEKDISEGDIQKQHIIIEQHRIDKPNREEEKGGEIVEEIGNNNRVDNHSTQERILQFLFGEDTMADPENLVDTSETETSYENSLPSNIRDCTYLVSDNSDIDLIDLYPELREVNEENKNRREDAEKVSSDSMVPGVDNKGIELQEGDVHQDEEREKKIDTLVEASEDRIDIRAQLKVKGISRRKVWLRWRDMIRNIHKRKNRKSKKLEDCNREPEADNQLVFDYTTNTLSREEISLLSKGESFSVVNHEIDEDSVKVDIYKYQRRLRLHKAFRDPEEVNQVEGNNSHQIVGRNGTVVSTVGASNRRSNRGQRDSITTVNSRRRVSLQQQDRVRSTQIPATRIRSEVNTRRSSRINNRGTITQEDNHHVRDSNIIQNRNRLSITTPQRRNSVSNQVRAGDNNSNNNNNINSEIVDPQKERKLPSTYDPESVNRNLLRYNNCIQEEIVLQIQDKYTRFKDNISKEERQALKSLKQRINKKEIIITKADKGSGLVALDYNLYVTKGTNYIEVEAKAYEKVQETEENIINRIAKVRDKNVTQLLENTIISKQTATYIRKQVESKITGLKFYYKIHKDRNIQTMPLRPLQSCINSTTQHLSIVLTDILQPLLKVENIPSFIYDSNQLLFRLNRLGSIPNDCTLISSDVSALYPSIPHAEGFQAMTKFLGEKTRYSKSQIKSIIKALELVITENYVKWNDSIYKQTSGVAMGTPVAVVYANIFMNWVDTELRQRAQYIYHHIRYIDDNLFIIPVEKIEDLILTANNILPPYIKFTYEKLDTKSEVGLPFLDTQLFIAEDYTIQSRLYTKKTDRHAYLLPTSYHPPHITQNIPAAVFGRIRKICSKEEWFKEDAQKAVQWLVGRGYNSEEVIRALDKMKSKDRWTMIKKVEDNRHKLIKQEETENVRIPFVMTYNHQVKGIREILKKRQNILDNSFRKTKVKPRLAYRRQKNLNDTLIQKGLRGPIASLDIEDNKFKVCGEKPEYRNRCPCKGNHRQDHCRCCMHADKQIEDINSKISKPVNCNTKNIVYVITCKVCRKRYVGETQQKLKERLAQHLYNIDKQNQPLYLHFRHVHKPENLRITILETVKNTEPFLRKVREAWWINQLQTMEPRGFNVKLDCNQIYVEDRASG